MTSFAYIAVDSEGRPVSGSIEAATTSDAEALLRDRGMTHVRLTQVDQHRVELPALTRAEAVGLAAYLAELAAAGLPLEGGLRALASDAESPRMARALTTLAARLEAGGSLESSLDALGNQLPEYVRAVIVASSRSGQLAGALDSLLTQERELNEMSGRFRQAATYPAVLLGFLVAWLLFVSLWLIPSMPAERSLDAFDVSKSYGLDEVEVRVQFARFVGRLILGIAGASCLTVLVAWALGGGAYLSRIAGRLPLVGSAWRQRGIVEFTGLLSTFLRRQLPLDESLRLTASAARDPAVRAACRRAARDVSSGASLSRFLDRSWFPPTLARLVEWGEQRASLASALETAREIFMDRFDRQTELTRLVLPPVVFLIIAGSVFFVVNGILSSVLLLVQWMANGPIPSPPMSQFGVGLPLAGAIIAAGGVLWVLSQLLRVAVASAVDARAFLRYTAVALISMGLLFACLLVGEMWGLLAWFVIVGIWARTSVHARAAARRNLFSALTLAAKEGMPVAPIGLAFAAEQDGKVAYQARDLGHVLDGGASLSDAAWMVPGALPPEAALAGRVGAETGDLAGALEATSGPRLFDRGLLRPLMVRLIYVVPAMMLFVTFMTIKIGPSMIKIFADFDTPLPPLTVAVLHGTPSPLDGLGLVSLTVFSLWFLGPLLIVLSLVVGVLAWLEWRGTLRPRLPGWKRIVNWLDMAMVLRLLALAAAHDRPLSTVLGNIVDFHPKKSVRNRMRVIEGEIVDGAVWQQSMRRQRLLSPNDAALLSAAERVGNLPWALGQMADSFERRANYRLQVVTQLVMPLLILPAGIVVGIIVVAYFMPMTTLVRSLS
jgi:general secretion pathway protein F